MKKEIDQYGTIRYYNELNQLHRDDEPTIEYKYGTLMVMNIQKKNS